MRYAFLFLCGFILMSGCTVVEENTEPESTEDKVIQVAAHQQIQVLPFQDGAGSATLVFDAGMADIIVTADGLNPDERYTIAVEGAVVFGPEENVQVRVGAIEDETLFVPNAEGELYVSMANLTRVLLQRSDLSVVIATEQGQEVMVTDRFQVNKREE